MFNNRQNSQKPDGEFITRFQQAFSDIVPRRDSRGEHDGTNGGDPMMIQRQADNSDMKMESHDVKFSVNPNNDRTPRNMHELGLTPSWMEPGSYSMMPLANQHPGFYTPNSGGMGAIFHNQAGDLHTPTGMHLITPLSLSGVSAANHPHASGFEPFNPHFLNAMNELNPYPQQSSYAPSAFMHRDAGYDVMDDTMDNSSFNDVHADTASNITASTDFSTHESGGGDMSYAKGDKFRFNSSLRAPTAMVKNKKEIPITYLNKGQAYNLSILDSCPPMGTQEPVRYRTCVRVSFEEPEQRAKPSTCWQLWKEGRGTSEAHQRGGKLLAVEYVDPLQGGGDVHKHRQVQVESMSVDGFCVTWTANPATGISDCHIPVRFNFLSTDFSHSKGVKGIPVRLCAKTELISPGEETGVSREMEMSYCKVKLFRDHGAERKLSNDIAHVKKTIEKLKQQVSQAEMGGGFGKRKRGNNNSSSAKSNDRSMKPASHKRTWSMGSDDGPPEKISLEDDLQSKLSMMQEMFSSTRPVSILGLRGEEADDPDLYPIKLDGNTVRFERMSRHNTSDMNSVESMIPSPANTNTSSSNSPPSLPTRSAKHLSTIKRNPSYEGVPRGFLDAVGIDKLYQPPVEVRPKPIACFYVRCPTLDQNPKECYRAIYLSERTVRDLLKQIFESSDIDPSCVAHVMRVNEKGLRITVDDNVVRELPEGQDMIIDISEASGPGESASGTSGPSLDLKLNY
ncbi:CP2 transcription factor [Penicillium brevicompactum]|uniref:CP2 transcription factor n=1 Tax=Penicillium brevicompactum TaxID=5074 RepID=A0A9W9QZQ6_PENBR|nr:CP2 transcription factor [Penicillium brevicompactum]